MAWSTPVPGIRISDCLNLIGQFGLLPSILQCDWSICVGMSEDITHALSAIVGMLISVLYENGREGISEGKTTVEFERFQHPNQVKRSSSKCFIT